MLSYFTRLLTPVMMRETHSQNVSKLKSLDRLLLPLELYIASVFEAHLLYIHYENPRLPLQLPVSSSSKSGIRAAAFGWHRTPSLVEPRFPLFQGPATAKLCFDRDKEEKLKLGIGA